MCLYPQKFHMFGPPKVSPCTPDSQNFHMSGLPKVSHVRTPKSFTCPYPKISCFRTTKNFTLLDPQNFHTPKIACFRTPKISHPWILINFTSP